MNKPNLIFIYPKKFTFIRTEIKLLEEGYNLKTHDLNWENKTALPLNLFQQLLFLFRNIFFTKSVLISFGGYWSLLPAIFGKMFNKKVFIVVHGTDCVDFSQIGYGNLRLPRMRFFIKYTYKLVDTILPVSDSLIFTENSYYNDEKLLFGYNHHFKNIKTKHHVIHNGINTNDWCRNDDINRNKNSFISVLSKGQFIRKGGELIVQLAKRLPDYEFIFAGIDNSDIPEELPNIKCLGYVTPDQLQDLYSKTQFYFQLSLFEGFGVAICEAMLCECIPIVSDVNFLPGIIGDSGFILKKRNVDMLDKLVNIAFNSSYDDLEKKARARVVDNFSYHKRKDNLLNFLNSQ